MVNPNPSDTKMVAPEPSPDKLVKIKTLRDIMVGDQIIKPDQEVMVTEEQAKEFCDKTFTGPHQFRGERDEVEAKQSIAKITRAVRL